jgi:RNase P/RNase MRP subunit POP5
MKALKPSHREKKRYLLLKGKDVSDKNVNDAILKYVGTLGYSKASPMFIKKMAKSMVISINRNELDKVKAALLVSNKDIIVEKVSGAITNLK